jgi:TolB-like protein/lipopolysaccharide biosynthesis regulator YciM
MERQQIDLPPLADGVGGIWPRLRRRKVVQWGIVYSAGAWGFLQGLEYVSQTFGWPGQMQRLATLALLVGLPIVLVTAWYHGDRGHQKVSATELLIIALLFLIGGGIFWRYERTDVAASSSVETGVTADPSLGSSTAPAAKSIAVLPFVNMSGDPQNEYFSDGISEEILNVLARVPELSVAARTSSFQFKGEKRDVAQIAAQLKVRMVLEGSVRKQAERVRVTAQLIDASTGYHLWSETYDRDLKDIFAIQDEIARAIGHELKVRVLGQSDGGQTVSGTTNVEAHDLYLKGLTLWRMRDEDDLFAAIDAFEQAIAIDAEFADAWAGLALTYAVLDDYTNRMPAAEIRLRALDAAQRAMAFDPTLAELYMAMGSIANKSGRKATAVALLRRAIRLRPSSPTAYQWLGTALSESGEVDEGIVSLQRAANLDPRSVIVANNLAYMSIIAGRNGDAVAACMPTLEYAPDSTLCAPVIGLAYLLQGDVARGRSFYARAAKSWGGGADRQIAELFDALEGRGDRRAFARRLAATPPRSWLDPASGYFLGDVEIPALLVLLGEPELAMDFVERIAANPVDLQWGLLMPVLDPIRCQPRFIAVAERLRVVDRRAAQICARRP